MITLANETAAVKQEYAVWVETQREDVVDRVRVALNRGYVENDLQAAFVEAMSFHARECMARYRTANVIEMVLGFETSMGNRWGLKR